MLFRSLAVVGDGTLDALEYGKLFGERGVHILHCPLYCLELLGIVGHCLDGGLDGGDVALHVGLQ